MHVIAGKAVALLEASQPSFREYCRQIVANARALADGMQRRGFRVVAGGTDVHLFLLSLVDRDVTGKQGQEVLERAGITTNKNMVPFDPRKPAVTSGVRIGTPAVTTRGMKEAEMETLAGLLARVLEKPDDEATITAVRAEVEALCRRFPLYPTRWSDAD
jgi:glycine hydroxymethyltransferase